MSSFAGWVFPVDSSSCCFPFNFSPQVYAEDGYLKLHFPNDAAKIKIKIYIYNNNKVGGILAD